MSQPLAHLYDLALRTLDQQERRAEAIRSRLGPVLAAAALGASVLSGPLVGGHAPATLAGRLALATTIGGLVVALTAAGRLLSRDHRVSPDTDARSLTAALEREGTLDVTAAFYGSMILRLSDQAAANATLLDGLRSAFTAMLYGINVMLCGLALAAIVE